MLLFGAHSFCLWHVKNTKLRTKPEVARAARYLGVVQYFRLGGVWFKAQHSLSFVKVIFNSPRIHLFMATCGRDGGINREPYKVLNPFRAGRSATRGFFRQKNMKQVRVRSPCCLHGILVFSDFRLLEAAQPGELHSRRFYFSVLIK